jgi:hypothetical protein
MAIFVVELVILIVALGLETWIVVQWGLAILIVALGLVILIVALGLETLIAVRWEIWTFVVEQVILIVSLLVICFFVSLEKETYWSLACVLMLIHLRSGRDHALGPEGLDAVYNLLQSVLVHHK